jgi:hypothetical protein
MSEYTVKLEGETLLNYLMGRCSMSREEAIAHMREHNQDRLRELA